jgi:hypothetical protein
MTDDMRHLGHDLAKLLDAAIPLMEAAAAAEARREAGKTLRKVSEKMRLEASRRAIVRAQAVFGYEP